MWLTGREQGAINDAQIQSVLNGHPTVTFDGQIVEMFIKKESFTYRYHIDLIESVEVDEKKFQTLFILEDKPEQKLGMQVVVDDDQRAASGCTGRCG